MSNTIALLEALLSTDNTTRSQAEQAYDALPIEQKSTMLFSALPSSSGVNEEGRQLAAVMLRRLLSSDFTSFYSTLGIQQETFKQDLLNLLQTEPNRNTRRKLIDLVAEVSRNLIDEQGNNGWPELLKLLFEMASSPSPELKESALHLFSSIPAAFGNLHNQYLDLIKRMLVASITDESSYEVRFAAAKATVSYLLHYSSEATVQKYLADIVGSILSVTMESIERCDDDALLKSLIELGESCPKLLRPQLDQLFAACLKVFSDAANQDDAWRHLALEVILTLCETAPAMVRKVAASQIPIILQATLHMMTEIEDDDEWATCDELADDENDNNSVVAESALDRIACSLGGKTIFPLILSTTPQMLAHSDWKFRHAALMAISAAGEGCHKQMESFLTQIMDGVMNFINDSHPRVRFACCNAIGQMSTDFSPVFQKKFHEKVIPGLLHLMDDNANPRVQAHAGAALVNFSEECPKVILTSYLDGIMSKLETILSSKFNELVEKGNKLVLEQVVTTIASVADTSEEKFKDYYDRFVPCLKYIIQNANTPELRMLRGKTIECISLIGLAVGGEKFSGDANEVMEMLLKSQTGEMDFADDDPQVTYMISAWARICKILGSGFAPYLPLVMGPVLKTASIKPEVTILDNEELGGLEDDNDEWQFINVGDQQNFGIKTAGLDEKATACQMLVCYARELKEHFVEYTEQTVRLMVPLLKFYFHDGVRCAAAESLPYLIECAKIRGQQYLQEMWGYICPELLKAIEAEPETSIIAEDLSSLARCIELLGVGCISDTYMQELVKIMISTFTNHFERQSERMSKRTDEDYDEGVEEQLVDEDDEDVYVLSKIGDVIHALFSTYKESFLPIFDQLLPFITQLLKEERSWTDKQWGLCMFDDLIEFTGPRSFDYQAHFADFLLHYIVSTQPEVRQAASYGAGVMGQYGGPIYASLCANAVPRLIQVIQDPQSREPENIVPTENAISAVTKILQWNASAINVDEVIPLWFMWLPVSEDVDEAPYVYGYLCNLIEANHPLILGPQNSYLPRIVSIFSEAFAVDALPPKHDVYLRMVNIVRQVQGNTEVFNMCVGSLNESQKRALGEALGSS